MWPEIRHGVEAIADDAAGTTRFAEYEYLGAGTIVSVAHPDVTDGLTPDYNQTGDYEGWDRFGRIINQEWTDAAGTTTLDHYTYTYDYRHRAIENTQHVRDGKSLTTKTTYVDNLVFSTEDPYGRKSFNAYRASDSALIRTVQATLPGPTGEPTTYAQVLALTRTTTPNAQLLISDVILDEEGQQMATIDPRGIVHTSTFDSRGRTTLSVEAATTAGSYDPATFDPTDDNDLDAIAAKTVTVYDAQSNVTETRSPRYFDSTDTEGENKANTVTTYTRRNLVETRTVAAGADAYVAGDPLKIKVAESFTYYNDGRARTRTDFRGNDWETLWHQCCGRNQGALDPAGHGTIRNNDFYNNVTHTAVVKDLAGDVTTNANGLRVIATAHNPNDARTVNETTTRYDARHRPIASTRWLVARGNVDPNSVPIAGGGATGDPAVEISGVKQGLTTRWFYDEDLTDGVGLDGAGISVTKLQGGGTFTLKIDELLDELSHDGTIPDGSNADFMATAVVNPEDEISVTISDGAGRTVASGIIEQ